MWFAHYTDQRWISCWLSLCWPNYLPRKCLQLQNNKIIINVTTCAKCFQGLLCMKLYSTCDMFIVCEENKYRCLSHFIVLLVCWVYTNCFLPEINGLAIQPGQPDLEQLHIANCKTQTMIKWRIYCWSPNKCLNSTKSCSLEWTEHSGNIKSIPVTRN